MLTRSETALSNRPTSRSRHVKAKRPVSNTLPTSNDSSQTSFPLAANARNNQGVTDELHQLLSFFN